MTADADCEDQKIVASVQRGNRQDFRRLVQRYQPVVAAMGRRMLTYETDCADYVQEVFMKAFTRLSQYTGKGRFYSWLMRIAYTTAINKVQRTVPEVPTDPDVLDRLWFTPEQQGPEEKTLRAELLNIVAQAIRELPQRYALAIEMYFFLNLRYAEIAEMTGLPDNTVKSHVRRARLLLFRKLSGTIAEDYHEL